MASEYDIFEFLEGERAEGISSMKRRRIQLRDECDSFNLEETEFVKRYRLTKDLARDLCDELRPQFNSPKKSTDLCVETKVLTALSFYATGSYQRPIGDNIGHSMTQRTVSDVIAQVTGCLNALHIREKYIHFPANHQERSKVITGYYKKFQIPGVLGCIDCTHVAIVRPNIHEERYYCRKHYHSLNVQMICDSNMQIISVDASYGGATHDSFIWAQHPLKAYLDELSNTERIWFLGDSGYPLRKTMMTPILIVAPDTPDAHYTNLQVRGRNIIKRTIGLLKSRFRCLLAHRVLHYAPEVAGSIVNTCVVLHNICNRANTPEQQMSDDEVISDALMQLVPTAAADNQRSNNRALQDGWDLRSDLIRQLWIRRQV